MLEKDDACTLFPNNGEDDLSLFVDDVLMPITSVRFNNAVGTWLDFETCGDDGRLLTGSLFTNQDRDEVCDIVSDALDNGRLLDISGRQATTRVPCTNRFFVLGTIRLANLHLLTPPARSDVNLN